MSAPNPTLVQLVRDHAPRHGCFVCSCGRWVGEGHPAHVAEEIERVLHVQPVTADEKPGRFKASQTGQRAVGLVPWDAGAA